MSFELPDLDMVAGEHDNHYAFFQRFRQLWSLYMSSHVTAGGAVTYVDAEDGDDSTGQRGSLTKRFRTITAAIAASVSGDFISVGPGVYTESVILPNFPISIVGAGPAATKVYTGDNSRATFNWRDTTHLQDVTIAGMYIVGGTGSAASCIIVNGHLAAGNCFAFATPLRLYDLVLELPGGSACTDVILLNEINVAFIDKAMGLSVLKYVNLTQVFGVYFENSGTFMIKLTNDASGDLPLSGLGISHIGSGEYGNIYVNKNAKLFCDKSAHVGDVVVDVLDNANASYIGGISFHGLASGNMSGVFTNTVNDTTGQFDFQDATILGNTNIRDKGTSSKRSGAYFNGATVMGLVTAGAYADIYITGGDHGGVASAGSGTVDRDLIRGAIDFTAGTPVAVTFNPPRATATFDVFIELTTGGAAAAPVLISSKASTGFTATPAAGGGNGGSWVAIDQK